MYIEQIRFRSEYALQNRSDNNVQDAIAKVQSIYSNLSAEENANLTKFIKNFRRLPNNHK